MINVLMCVHKSGDVLELTLKQLLTCPEITRILIADGPHLGDISPGIKVDKPSVQEVVTSLDNHRIFYKFTDTLPTRSAKNNDILPNATNDCQWMLTVDSDEVYHEDDLKRLVKFLKRNPEWGRYRIKTIDLYPDFHHEFRIPDWKPRLYKHKKGNCCPKPDRSHQFVLGPNQKRCPNGAIKGMADLDPSVCSLFHLNALRNPEVKNRITDHGDGTITWKGGRTKFKSEIYEIDPKDLPKAIRELGRNTLWESKES